MPEGISNSVVDLGDISKPADTLIQKISDAVGGVFAPFQIKRIAKAEAEAAIISAQTEIQITDLHRRAMHRFIEEEAKRQKNIEEITTKALPQLTAEANPNSMDNDWVTNFFERSRIVSDEEMQKIWAKVLAGEANAPGTYSKRTVNFLGDLDKKDAELFQSLCSFGWFVGSFTPLIFDSQNKIYTNRGINFNVLTHLDAIGLIRFDPLSGFERQGIPKQFLVSYCGSPLMLTMTNETGNSLTIGQVLLTKMGEELVKVCNAPRVADFMEYVKEKWKGYLPQV